MTYVRNEKDPSICSIVNNADINGSESELRSFKHYTSDTEYAGAINAVARDRNCGTDEIWKIDSMVRNDYYNIKNCADRNTLPKMLLIRGTSLYNLSKAIFLEEQEAMVFLQDCVKLSDSQMDQKYGNRDFICRQFMSTSKKCWVACDFSDYSDGCLLEIHIPNGTPGVDLSHFSEYSEEEVLLTSDLRIRFDSFETVGEGQKYIKMSVVGK